MASLCGRPSCEGVAVLCCGTQGVAPRGFTKILILLFCLMKRFVRTKSRKDRAPTQLGRIEKANYELLGAVVMSNKGVSAVVCTQIDVGKKVRVGNDVETCYIIWSFDSQRGVSFFIDGELRVL